MCRRTARNESIPERCFAFWARSPEDFRAPLVLYYMEDLSYKEIADVLALPLGTVQSRIARAKIQLLRRLSETNLSLEQVK